MNRIDRLIKMMDKKSTIEHSAYFDAIWYAKRYGLEVNEAAEHYLKYGYRHGFDPSKHFSTREYLANNPDVKMNPLLHYELYGKYEGRLGVKEIENSTGSFIELNQVKDLIDKADIVSFDIFDTLIVRPFVNDEDIYKYIEEKYGLDHFAFYREEAEKKARIKYRRDIDLNEIYEQMPYRYQDKIGIELDAHYELVSFNIQLKAIYDYCISQNKKMICISDMYLSSDFEKKQLNKCGFNKIDEVYCSSKTDMSKANGKLYDYVLGIYPGKKILHFGDNWISDIKTARDKGLDAVCINRNFDVLCGRFDYLRDKQGSLSYSLSLGITANKYYELRNHDDDYLFGFIIGGPLALSYVSYICETAKKNDIEHLLFVARDGYVLKKIYDKYYKNRYGFSSGYGYVTRSCMLSATLDYSGEERYLKKLLIMAKDSGIGIDINGDLQEEYVKNRNELEKWANNNCRNLRQHLEKECGQSRRIMAVDLNTKHFSSLRALGYLLKDREFLGMFNIVFGRDCDMPYETFSNKLTGAEDMNCASTSEILLSSPEDSILRIDDSLMPVYEKDESKKNYPDIMQGILDYVDIFENYNAGFGLMSFDEWMELCRNYILRSDDAKKRIEVHMNSSI